MGYDCYRCHDTGQIKQESQRLCSGCDGHKTVPPWKQSPSGERGNAPIGDVTCSKCGGTGNGHGTEIRWVTCGCRIGALIGDDDRRIPIDPRLIFLLLKLTAVCVGSVWLYDFYITSPFLRTGIVGSIVSTILTVGSALWGALVWTALALWGVVASVIGGTWWAVTHPLSAGWAIAKAVVLLFAVLFVGAVFVETVKQRAAFPGAIIALVAWWLLYRVGVWWFTPAPFSFW